MTKIKCYTLMVLGLLLGSACQQNGEEHTHQHTSNKTGNSAEENFDCGYCGMPSDEFPQFHAKIKTQDQKTVWFCSTRCMFISTLQPDSPYKGATQRQVMDYYENKWIDAESAFFVIGGDVPGPMGADLIPHKDLPAAEEFMEEHKGKKILKAKEVSQATIKELVNR